MPIINYDDYYKPNKPQPKAPTKYYQPPKPKAAPPQKYTDYSQGRYGAAYTPPKDSGMNFFQQMMDRINSALMNQVNSLPPQTYPTKINEPKISLQNLRNTTQQPNWNPNTPIGNTLASSYNYDYKADNPAYWSPNPLYGKRWITQNYVDERGQQRTRSVYVTYPEPPASPWLSTTPVPGAYVNPYAQAGAAPAYTNYSHGRYANPARMGGTSSVGAGATAMTDTGGASGTKAYAPPFAGVPANWNKPAGQSYKRETLAELLARGAVDPWASDPYEIGGAGTDWGYRSQEETLEVGDTGGWGYGGWGGGGWGGGGGGAYGASSGVNSYLPGTRAGYGANASSPRYTGGTGGRGSSYAGAQSMNQAAWRMPMLVWNI